MVYEVIVHANVRCQAIMRIDADNEELAEAQGRSLTKLRSSIWEPETTPGTGDIDFVTVEAFD